MTTSKDAHALLDDLMADPRRSLLLHLIITDRNALTDTGLACAVGPDGLHCGYTSAPATRRAFGPDEPLGSVIQAIVAGRPMPAAAEADREPPGSPKETAMPPAPTAPVPQPTTLEDPIHFAHTLFDQMYEHLPVYAPLEVAMAPVIETEHRLRELLAEQPEAWRLAGTLSDACSNIAVEQYSLGIEFGVAAEQLRQVLRASLSEQRRD